MSAAAAGTWAGGAPERSLAQRRAALVEANRIRSTRARLKAELGGMPRQDAVAGVRELIARPTPEVKTMRVRDLLVSPRGLGPSRGDRLMRGARCSPSKTVAGLSERQRSELLALLGGGRR